MRIYFGIVGGLCLAFALWLFLRLAAVAFGGNSATGRIVGFATRQDDDSIYYLPVVSFIDLEGRERRFTSPAGDSNQSPPVGTEVRVRYLGDAPDGAFIESLLPMWGAPAGFAVLGLAAVFAYLH